MQNPGMAGLVSFEAALQRLSAWILRQSTVPNFLVCLTLFSGLLYQMSRLAAEARDFTELPLLDSRTSYSPKDAFVLLNALGADGRSIYLQFNAFEIFFPAVTAAFMAIIIGPLYHRAGLWSQVNVFPLLYFAFDTSEGLAVRYLLKSFPSWPVKLAFLASELTRYKIRFLLYTTGIIIFGLLALTRRMVMAWWTRRQQRHASGNARDHLE